MNGYIEFYNDFFFNTFAPNSKSLPLPCAKDKILSPTASVLKSILGFFSLRVNKVGSGICRTLINEKLKTFAFPSKMPKAHS